MKNFKHAFTLAEVLITLAVIGVVAAITMPSLIKNYKKHVVENRLKSAYSIFSQAITNAKAEYGDVSGWDESLSNEDFAERYINPYLTIIDTKILNMNTQMYSLNIDSSGARQRYYHANYDRGKTMYYLKNGMRFSPDNKMQEGGFGYNLFITVDINGDEKPNILGYDGFVFVLNKDTNQLLPSGYNVDSSVLTLDKSYGSACVNSALGGYYTGEYCAELIRRNNWKIPKDYVW